VRAREGGRVLADRQTTPLLLDRLPASGRNEEAHALAPRQSSNQPGRSLKKMTDRNFAQRAEAMIRRSLLKLCVRSCLRLGRGLWPREIKDALRTAARLSRSQSIDLGDALSRAGFTQQPAQDDIAVRDPTTLRQGRRRRSARRRTARATSTTKGNPQ
jgi:hypothetical protein